MTPSDDPVAAFVRRECDLVIARSDVKLPGWARSIANLEKEIVLIVARKGARLAAPSDLKKFSFIIPSPSTGDEALLREIFSAYDFGKTDLRSSVQTNGESIAAALGASPATAVFVVAPMSRLVQGHLLGGLPQKVPVALLDWPDSKALGKKVRGLSDETIDVGLFSVSPLLPADDLDALSLTDMLLDAQPIARIDRL